MCTVIGCDAEKTVARGLCRKHYQRWWQTGDPLGSSRVPRADRLWAKVEKTETCWLWTGYVNNKGYGLISRGSPATTYERKLVHRVAYELEVGPIPEGLEIDHLCRVRNCVRPDHLEPVTRHENVLRARRDECPQGHSLLDSSNVYLWRGSRLCRTCRDAALLRRKERAKAPLRTP